MTLALALARVAPVVFLIPPLRSAWLARAIAALVLSAFVAPAISAPFSAQAMMGELLIGLAVGFAASIPFHVFAALGGWFAWVTVPRTRTLFMLLGLALFAAASGPQRLAAALVGTYEAIPCGTWPAIYAEALLPAALKLVLLAIAMGAPLLLALLLTDLAGALVVRAQPALLDAMEVRPLRTGVALVLLFATLAVRPTAYLTAVAEIPTAIEQATSALR